MKDGKKKKENKKGTTIKKKTESQKVRWRNIQRQTDLEVTVGLPRQIFFLSTEKMNRMNRTLASPCLGWENPIGKGSR